MSSAGEANCVLAIGGSLSAARQLDAGSVIACARYPTANAVANSRLPPEAGVIKRGVSPDAHLFNFNGLCAPNPPVCYISVVSAVASVNWFAVNRPSALAEELAEGAVQR